jgi:hypothetical protein
MISDNDRKILTEAGREYIFDATINSRTLKEKLTASEYTDLCNQINKLTYEEVITLTITEDIRAFEGKFKKFLKYSFAAIAGMIAGPGAPILGMIVFYFYRKLTDDCYRECAELPMFSGQRKVCKKNCELDAAKKVYARIRSDMGKCKSLEDPDRCEKKLLKQQIKWGKRIQQLMIGLNTVKAKARDVQVKQQQQQQRSMQYNSRIYKIFEKYSLEYLYEEELDVKKKT